MKKFFKITILLLLCLVVLLVVHNELQSIRVDKVLDEKVLSQSEKDAISEYYKLTSEYATEIWSGFKGDEIPIIIYNDKYEFLLGYSGEAKDYDIVNGDDFFGMAYYRKVSKNPQAFAVNVDGSWVGSMSTLDYLNKNLYQTLRKELPFPINKILPFQLVKRSYDFHIMAILHEGFHAFQAIQSSQKFDMTQKNYSLEKDYPYYDETLNNLFTEEGKKLSSALEAHDKTEKMKLIEEFLEIRNKRRKNLSEDLVKFEQGYEWLEGLAKYVEIKGYEVALENSEGLSLKYKDDLSYWTTEFNNLKNLGKRDSELRFYISGMAQARLLDDLGIEWKKQIMNESVYFEDLFKEIIN